MPQVQEPAFRRKHSIFQEEKHGIGFFKFKDELKKAFEADLRPLASGRLSTKTYRNGYYEQLNYSPKRRIQTELSLLNWLTNGKVTARDINKKTKETRNPFFIELQDAVDKIIKERWREVGTRL